MLSPVPIGTVDFVISIFFFVVYFKISLVHLYTNDKSTSNDPFFVGVPTQMKIISEEFIDFFISVLKERRFAK